MKTKTILTLMTALLIINTSAEARDLVSAANSATDVVKNVAQALSILGVVAGGALMQVPGAAQFARGVLVSGAVGVLCAFGAPAFISFIKQIFGSL